MIIIFPLSLFDVEPNHLFLYQRYVSSSEFIFSSKENNLTYYFRRAVLVQPTIPFVLDSDGS